MALPDYRKAELGTAIVWGEAGGAGVTLTMSLDALADGSARMGAVGDLGAQWDQEYIAILALETGTAPTAGTTAELYLASTPSTSYYPGGVTGADGAWPADGAEDEWRLQLGAPAVVLVATNDGTVLQVQQATLWRPAGRYVVPVVDNNLGQALRDVTPNSGNLSRVLLYPVRDFIQDGA